MNDCYVKVPIWQCIHFNYTCLSYTSSFLSRTHSQSCLQTHSFKKTQYLWLALNKYNHAPLMGETFFSYVASSVDELAPKSAYMWGLLIHKCQETTTKFLRCRLFILAARQMVVYQLELPKVSAQRDTKECDDRPYSETENNAQTHRGHGTVQMEILPPTRHLCGMEQEPIQGPRYPQPSNPTGAPFIRTSEARLVGEDVRAQGLPWGRWHPYGLVFLFLYF